MYTASWNNTGDSSPGTLYYVQPNTNANPDRENNTVIANAYQSNIVVAPGACTMLALNVGANNYGSSASDSTTVTVYQNGSATAMTCSVTTNGNGSSCTDNTDTFSVAGGDTLTLGYSETSNTPLVMVTTTLICQ
jgi:hypothetical protein